MALWKEQASTLQKEAFEGPKVESNGNGNVNGNGNGSGNGTVRHEAPSPLPRPVGRVQVGERKESVIAAELTIEGKIEGAGHVRIAGRFKGDIHVDGNLTIEEGAHLAGELRADTIVVSGELEGSIQTASHVELMETGTITGDVKAGTMTVARGSRMRGRAEFGWDAPAAAAS